MAVAVGVVSLAFGLFTWQDRIATESKAKDDLARVATLMEEHTRATLVAQRLILDDLAAILPRQPLSQWTAPAEFADRLEAMAARLPAIYSLSVFDETGRPIAIAGQHTVIDAEADASEYFRIHRQQGDTGLFVSHLLWGPRAGTFLFALSQPLRDEGGRLNGVVVAFVHSGFFTRFYDRMALGDNAAYGIFRLDGSIVVRSPMPLLGPAAEKLRTSAMFRHSVVTAANGTYSVLSGIDGVQRLIAFRRLDDAPLVVASALRTDTLFTAWRDRMRRNGLIAVASNLVFLLLGGLTLTSLRREKGAEMALAAYAAEQAAAREEAQRATEEKNRFIATASHDLRQPMQAMRLYFEILDSQMTASGRKAADGMRTAMEASERLLHALLDVSKLEAGQINPVIAPVAVADLFADLDAQFAPVAASKHLRFDIVASGAVVTTDATLLRQVLANLVSNAAKYTDSGRILIGCRRRGGDRLAIEVHDTGRGIPPHLTDKVFEDFYQIGNEERRSVNGYGLGLSVVRRTARLLGHEVAVTSRLGKGSCFTVVVPCGTLRRHPGPRRVPAVAAAR